MDRFDGDDNPRFESLWSIEEIRERPGLVVDIGQPDFLLRARLNEYFETEPGKAMRYLSVDPDLNPDALSGFSEYGGAKGIPTDVFELLVKHPELKNQADKVWVKNFLLAIQMVERDQGSKLSSLLANLVKPDGEVVLWDWMTDLVSDDLKSKIVAVLENDFDVQEFDPSMSDDPYVKKVCKLEDSFLEEDGYAYAYRLRPKRRRRDG